MRFRERISILKSSLLAARRRILHLSVQAHSYSCIIYLFLLVFFFFMPEKIMRRALSATTYCFSASNFSVGPQRLSSHRRPLRHRYNAASKISWRLLPPQLGPSAEATYSFNCLSELSNWSNFAFILPLPLVKLHSFFVPRRYLCILHVYIKMPSQAFSRILI